MTDRPSPAPVRTLADALRGWDDGALAALVLARPDLARPAPADLGQLATRAGGRGSVALAVDRLDTAHLAVVEGLALLPEPVSRAELERLVYAAPATVATVLRRLAGLALVWGDNTDLRLVRVAKDVVGPTPAGLGPGLVPLLTAARPARVHALADDLQIAPAADSMVVATRIAAAYADPAWTRNRIDEASTAAGAEAPRLLDRLAAGPPTGRLGAVPPDVRIATATGALQHLVARGLLVTVDDRTVTLPREVGLVLRGGRTTSAPVDTPPQPTTAPAHADLVDSSGAGAAHDTVRRVELVLERFGASPPAVLRSGGIGVRDVRALAGELGVDEGETGLLLEVARAAGLLGVGDHPERGEVWAPTGDLDRFRALPAADRWVRLASAWLSTARATVLVGGRDEHDRPVNPLAPGLERGAVAALRRSTLQVFVDVGPGVAVDDAQQVVDAVAWTRPRRVALRDATVLHTLVEAAQLGVLAGRALTGAGLALLTDPDKAADRLGTLLPEPVDHVLLQADLTAVAPGPLEPVIAHGLALLADVESRGGATVYRFGADTVRRALDAGWPVAEVHTFLATHSRTPVPQPLTYLVDDAARRHGQLRVGAGEAYVRADDPAELDAVLADASLAALRLRRVAPTVALTDAPADVVVAGLRRAHRAPLLEGADGCQVSTEPIRHRARSRPAPAHDLPALTAAEAAAVAAAIRAGEHARAARPGGGRDTGPARLVQQLQAAVEDRRTVWLAYLDDTGTVSERVVDPVGVDGGRLTAYDHRSARTRGFTLHRISHVAAVG